MSKEPNAMHSQSIRKIQNFEQMDTNSTLTISDILISMRSSDFIDTPFNLTGAYNNRKLTDLWGNILLSKNGNIETLNVDFCCSTSCFTKIIPATSLPKRGAELARRSSIPSLNKKQCNRPELMQYVPLIAEFVEKYNGRVIGDRYIVVDSLRIIITNDYAWINNGGSRHFYNLESTLIWLMS